VCDTDDALNIAFLMDESGSVDEDEWDIITSFVDRIATFDVSGSSYVSLTEYASKVGYDNFLNWTSIADDSAAVTQALSRNNYNAAGLTYTWDAVNRVLDDFWNYRKNCTDGCETRHDVLFLLTDGAPTDEVCPDMIPRANSTTVDIIIIGIGTTADAQDGWMDDISCLDIADDYNDIYYVTDFDADDFNAIEGIIRNYTCNGLNPAGVADRGGDPWVYDDGSTGLGPVPTSSGDYTAPTELAEHAHAGRGGEELVVIHDDAIGSMAMPAMWWLNQRVVLLITALLATMSAAFMAMRCRKREYIPLLDGPAKSVQTQYGSECAV
jgi:uncharacterized protein YegL